NQLIPVRLPPGRLKLATKPCWTGSPAVVNTTGIVVVAALAANTEAPPPVAAIAATFRSTRSAASAGNRSGEPSAKRYSIATLRPSTKPTSLKPRRNASLRFGRSFCPRLVRKPTTGNHWLLRAQGERPRRRRAAEQRDELPALHVCAHSITSSA